MTISSKNRHAIYVCVYHARAVNIELARLPCVRVA